MCERNAVAVVSVAHVYQFVCITYSTVIRNAFAQCYEVTDDVQKMVSI